MFELFTQVGRETSRAQGGLGIGLTLVKSLVEMHGGSVEARSDGPGMGSEFIIRLADGGRCSLCSGRRLAALAVAFVGMRRVLVVDDNHDSAESMGMLLRFLGADVRIVYSGAERSKPLSAFRPTVVLLDIGMPELDGYEVARRIRQRPRVSASR